MHQVRTFCKQPPTSPRHCIPHPPTTTTNALSCTAVVDRDILRYGAVKKKGEAECVFIREMHFVEMTCLNMRVGVRFWR